MPMQSFGDCPWCGAKIDLIKEGRVWICPVCACTFTRKVPKWKTGIAAAVVVAVLLWRFVPAHAVLAATLAAIGILMVTAKSGSNRIESRGRIDLTAGEARTHKAQWKESKWFIGAVALLLVAILAGIIFGLMART